jgi:hypothetical protein
MTTKTFIDRHHQDMVDNKRWGQLIIVYQNGEPVVVKKEETLKPPKENGNGGYQPNGKRLDSSDPPKGGSGVPRK